MSDTSSELTDYLAKALAGIALFGLGALLATHFLGKSGNAAFVTLDSVQVMNAQRAAASSLLNESLSVSERAERYSMIQRLGSQTMSVVERIADGRAVVVKQAVISGDVEDITGEVLTELGLSDIKVPTLETPLERDLMPLTPEMAAVQLMSKESRKRIEARFQETMREESLKHEKDILP